MLLPESMAEMARVSQTSLPSLDGITQTQNMQSYDLLDDGALEPLRKKLGWMFVEF